MPREGKSTFKPFSTQPSVEVLSMHLCNVLIELKQLAKRKYHRFSAVYSFLEEDTASLAALASNKQLPSDATGSCVFEWKKWGLNQKQLKKIVMIPAQNKLQTMWSLWFPVHLMSINYVPVLLSMSWLHTPTKNNKQLIITSIPSIPSIPSIQDANHIKRTAYQATC